MVFKERVCVFDFTCMCLAFSQLVQNTHHPPRLWTSCPSSSHCINGLDVVDTHTPILSFPSWLCVRVPSTLWCLDCYKCALSLWFFSFLPTSINLHPYKVQHASQNHRWSEDFDILGNIPRYVSSQYTHTLSTSAVPNSNNTKRDTSLWCSLLCTW